MRVSSIIRHIGWFDSVDIPSIHGLSSSIIIIVVAACVCIDIAVLHVQWLVLLSAKTSYNKIISIIEQTTNLFKKNNIVSGSSSSSILLAIQEILCLLATCVGVMPVRKAVHASMVSDWFLSAWIIDQVHSRREGWWWWCWW